VNPRREFRREAHQRRDVHADVVSGSQRRSAVAAAGTETRPTARRGVPASGTLYPGAHGHIEPEAAHRQLLHQPPFQVQLVIAIDCLSRSLAESCAPVGTADQRL